MEATESRCRSQIAAKQTPTVLLLRPVKPRLLLALILVGGRALLPAAESSVAVAPTILVSVHGAWGGGWQMQKVAPLLEARGWKVYRPSLSGLGEHFNTTSTGIGLQTHIDDIVNFILFENLHDVVLLGHSYGGMVITGVADRIPERIRKLIYLDALLPLDGENVMSLGSTKDFDLSKMTKDGYIVPSWVKPDKPLPHDVPQPLLTFTDPIRLVHQDAAAKIPACYILTVDPGKKPEDDAFFRFYERARARGWTVTTMEADHNPQWRKPEATAALLEAAAH